MIEIPWSATAKSFTLPTGMRECTIDEMINDFDGDFAEPLRMPNSKASGNICCDASLQDLWND